MIVINFHNDKVVIPFKNGNSSTKKLKFIGFKCTQGRNSLQKRKFFNTDERNYKVDVEVEEVVIPFKNGNSSTYMQLTGYIGEPTKEKS